jgi:UDP-sugar transporter A1/2/3
VHRVQWISLLLLTAGVSLAQLGGEKGDPSKGENTVSGFVAVLAAACTSGFAGVYFEKMLKGANTSIWMRNVQICCTSIGLGLVTIWASGDGDAVYTHGFFYG